MYKVKAMNNKGQITECRVRPEDRGKGRCNHVIHQEEGESVQEFIERASKQNPKFASYFDDPISGELEIEQYKMSNSEKENLVMILGRKHLDEDIEGGYIELAEPLWNDMDKNSYSKQFSVPLRDINAVLNGDSFIVTKLSDEIPSRLKEGQIVKKELVEKINNKYPKQFEFDTGVVAMNELAASKGFEATRDVYVLPYYMRQNPPGGTAKNPINTLYNLLILKRKNPDEQQKAYEALLNNSKAAKPVTQRGGFPISSLAEEFKGKSGVMRANMSGRRIANSGRALITPDANMEYGVVKIPASMAAKIYEDTIVDNLRQDGKSEEEISEFMNEFKGVDQADIPLGVKRNLEDIVKRSGVRAIMNRQPSLHMSSLLSFRPEISPDATVKVNPLNLPGYNGDFDGDTATIFGINDVEIANTAKDMRPDSKYGTHMPRAQKEIISRPAKESLWGLYNILSKRS